MSLIHGVILTAVMLCADTVVYAAASPLEAAVSQTPAPDKVVTAPGDTAFVISTITPEIEARISGRSYSRGCPVPLADLRYLSVLHHDGHGAVRRGELICHHSVAAELLSIFRELYAAGYPIEHMVLIDEYGADDEASMRANNTSCFNYRQVAGSSTLSRHAYGMAVDINPLYNPYVRMRGRRLIVRPAEGRSYVERNLQADNPYIIRADDAVVRAFGSRGWRWGGAWRRYKDYQHFDKTLPHMRR